MMHIVVTAQPTSWDRCQGQREKSGAGRNCEDILAGRWSWGMYCLLVRIWTQAIPGVSHRNRYLRDLPKSYGCRRSCTALDAPHDWHFSSSAIAEFLPGDHEVPAHMRACIRLHPPSPFVPIQRWPPQVTSPPRPQALQIAPWNQNGLDQRR